MFPPGIIQQVRGCTSTVFGEMIFSSNLALSFLCSCSCTALSLSQQGAKDQRPRGPYFPTGKQARGSWSSPEDNRQFANSSPPCVHHATVFWLFFPDQEILAQLLVITKPPTTQDRDSCTRQALTKGCCDFGNEEVCPFLLTSAPTPTCDDPRYDTASLRLVHPFCKTRLTIVHLTLPGSSV